MFAFRSGHKASNRVVGERLCKHKYSAYCVDDIDDVTPGDDCSDVASHNHDSQNHSSHNHDCHGSHNHESHCHHHGSHHSLTHDSASHHHAAETLNTVALEASENGVPAGD